MGASGHLGLEEELRILLGLNKYEARLYLAILRGASNPRQASEASGVPLPRVYDVVKSLEAKGLVKPKGNWYTAVDVSEALSAVASKIVGEAVERARSVVKLAERLSSYARAGEGAEEFIEIIRGLRQVLAKSFALAGKARTVYLIAWKALERLDVVKPFLEAYRPLLKDVDVRLVIPCYYKLSEEDERLLKSVGIKWVRVHGVMLDSMIVDNHTMVVGVPDPKAKDEAVAIVIRNRTFVEAVKNLVDKIWAKNPRC